ncbi:alpha/beta hydrolase [Oxalobacteraceae bacterium R-40]|uniref:Alpha/beta hydrolase n=1 Tax=Keguizhuia sedimenti TaxID=3064264 RepID=A0ABU1BMT6_9BURK|nr:alpha/beta hydrolase [Oxalobacteraceae bacterium R-40]
MVYKEWGKENNPNVLICVHGLTRASDDFDALADALCGQYRIICPDVVGRGRSSWLKNPAYYTLPVYVSDLLHLIAQARTETLAWLGTSMGGLIGMMIAAMDAGYVQKLILNDIGPALNPAAMSRIGDYVGQQHEFATFEEAEQYVRNISSSFGPHDEEQWHKLARNVLKTNAQGKWIRNHDPGIALPFHSQMEGGRQQAEKLLWAAYESLSCPTLLVRGRESDLLTASTAREMTRRGPKAKLIELDEVGHAPMFMHAEQIELVTRFLNS